MQQCMPYTHAAHACATSVPQALDAIEHNSVQALRLWSASQLLGGDCNCMCVALHRQPLRVHPPPQTLPHTLPHHHCSPPSISINIHALARTNMSRTMCMYCRKNHVASRGRDTQKENVG
eukprot:GDKI01008710.1.p1 GENE.GDKI01008710.1~~GDKI01008710.1.p1  ORF type:complete len:120 (-),score=14.66 GDKI01008710.1:181-540(-)